MSMLAGPRRKQKVINLRAKNNDWSNDANKFGQKMLEKMGWTAGKGLGANENGMVDHVIAKYKNDDRGLGYEDKNDQWTKHEDDFNALLSNLSKTESNADNLHSGTSLEEKSKKSKARIHYHKFTRGKDISRYSEKDLANIFGKKSFKETEVEEILQGDVKTTEQVFTEKGTMDDYFKSKLANLKSKSKLLNNVCIENDDRQISDYSFKGFSNTSETENDNVTSNNSFGDQSYSFYGFQSGGTEEPLNKTENIEIAKTNKKKNSKNKESKEISDSSANENVLEETSVTQDPERKVKKSKKKKHQQEIDITECDPPKKKKKNKECSENIEQEQTIISEEIKKPKKKKKRKDLE